MLQRRDTPCILARNVSWKPEGGPTIVTDVSLSLDNTHTALVGRNGIGKTTLLRLIMGEITPTEGDVERFCEVGYLPQVFTAVPGETVAALLGIADKLRAISEIEAGAYDPSLFDMVDADWDAAERAKALLHKLDLPHIELTQQVNEVSGGELTRIAFVAILLRSPDFLVLDEPTNNLDQPARLAMRRFLKEWKGGLLVVAHDRELLADVDLILELSQGGIKSYRGNFEHPKD